MKHDKKGMKHQTPLSLPSLFARTGRESADAHFSGKDIPLLLRKSEDAHFLAKIKDFVKNGNGTGGKMLGFIGVILMIAELSAAQPLGIDTNGMVDEIVVTAPRYAEEAHAGMMPEIVIRAPRYEHEDIAWSGLMPEIVVTAPRVSAPELGQLISPEPAHHPKKRFYD